jgi:methylisocitrate lyase
MTWFTTAAGQDRPGDRLEALWSRPGALGVPGAHNGLTGILARDAGFEALYLSGGALSASMGLPDLGMITPEELAMFVKMITRSTGLPLIVDGDTGYGEALNVMRLIQDLEAAGAAAVQLEDQILPPPGARAPICASSPAPTPPRRRGWKARSAAPGSISRPAPM